MGKVIKVSGRGAVDVMPDWVQLHISISDVGTDYEAVLKASAAMTELARIALQRNGFQKEDVVTEYFDVVPVYDEGTEAASGYRYIHCLKLEMPYNNKRLTACMTELGKCITDPEFWVTYTVKDPEATKDMLLAQAVGTARRKAEILAQAAGVSLGTIESIEYSWEDREIASATEPVLAVPSSEERPVRASMNVVPEKITLDDMVTVTWEII